MMREHLDLTLAEVENRLAGDHVAEIELYDRVVDEILHMADTFSSGLVEQFPARS